MYHDGIHYNVILLDDACGVPGSIWHNADDSYTVFIDASLGSQKQKEVFMHEINHVKNNDFEKFDVQYIESNAHKNRSNVGALER